MQLHSNFISITHNMLYIVGVAYLKNVWGYQTQI